MSRLDKVREKVIEAVPEIMELKFGCRVQLKRNLHTRFKGEIGAIAGQPDGYAIAFENGHQVVTQDGEDDFKILGREITLADVLRAIGPNKLITYDGGARSSTGNLVVNMSGVFMNENGMHLAEWDLSKPLSGQSEETIDFLYKILCEELKPLSDEDFIKNGF